MGFLSLLILGAVFYLFNKISDQVDRISRHSEEIAGLLARIAKLEEAMRSGPFTPEVPPLKAAGERLEPAKSKQDIPEPAHPPIPIEPVPFPRPIVDAPEPEPRKFPMPAIDWEQFMGVKLFAWLGGFALFLGMAFFVKYSIDRNLITPLMRVILGYFTGIGVILGGLWLRRKGYAVTVQTLCAAGISILYADIFSCRAVYNFVGAGTAFPLMVLVTTASFLLAARLDSRYVAILGLIGGFLTPPLLSTGVDRPIALFAYIAMLDFGLVALSLKKRWEFLISLSAAATFIMELGWTGHFFEPSKLTVAAGIYLFFCAFYLLVHHAAARRDISEPLAHAPALAMPLLAMGFVAYLLTFHSLATNPAMVLTLLLLLGAASAYMALRREEGPVFYGMGGAATFLILLIWTIAYLKGNLLSLGLGFYFAFAVIHAAFPVVLQKFRPQNKLSAASFLAPLLMLALIFIAMLTAEFLSFLIWPFILLTSGVALMAAWLAASVWAMGVTILLVLGSFGIWLFRLPDAGGLPGILTLLAFFILAFFAWGLFLLWPGNEKIRGYFPQCGSKAGSADPTQLPVFSALMPFLLLAMVCVKIPLANPSEVFGLALLLNVLLLALTRYRPADFVSVLAVAGTGLMEFSWHANNYDLRSPAYPLLWYTGFYALFALFPLIFNKHIKGKNPWIAFASASVVQFLLEYKVLSTAVGKAFIGLVPAFFAIPALAGLYAVKETIPASDPRRQSLLALQGGMALFFITLIIPLQFDKEWITLGWALEGAALLWLFLRIPHPGLRGWGLALLAVSFIRLTLNPAVFSYHPRTATPILNWYLWVYGAAIASFFWGARLLKSPNDLLRGIALPPVLNSLGTILSFLLLNIEIADFFSSGSTITFEFSRNLAQDMTYSLCWAAFGITLLLIGIRQASQGARYASLGLLLVTIAKVFLHDLWQLGQLYRVGSIIGLAVILILVSFLYQRFLGEDKNGSAAKPSPQEGNA